MSRVTKKCLMKKKKKTTKKKTAAPQKVAKKTARVPKEPPLTPAEMTKLRARAELRKLPMSYKVLSLSEMQQVQQWTAGDGGFQRPLSTKQVNGVTDFMLHSPTPVIPPVLLARVKGDQTGKRWCIDGQHRLKGAIQAEMCIPAVTIIVDSLEQARYLFLIYNSKMSKVSQKFIGLVSNNKVAVTTRALAADYDAFYEHVKRLGIGLDFGKTTKYWDEVVHDANIPEATLTKTRLILDLWTRDPRWTPEKFPKEKPGEVTRVVSRRIIASCKSAYCVPGVLQVVGAVVRDLGATSRKQITTIVEVAQDTMTFKTTAFRRDAGLNGMETWCKQIELLKANVAIRALQATV